MPVPWPRVKQFRGCPVSGSLVSPARAVGRNRLAARAPYLSAGFWKAFTSRYINVGGLCLYAVTGGDGPPLLVHG